MRALIYGTAWKEDDTKRCVSLALAAGFRAIDTANQRKHYVEAAVGDAIASSDVRREDVWIQTKFTHRDGQDERLPYDPKASITKQVEQSFSSSLDHLRTEFVDSYVLHGPSQGVGLAPEDLEAWAAMEQIHASGKARALGVSNVSSAQLEILLRHSTVKVGSVQNRCYASRGWDEGTRALCRKHGIAYQGFSLLTANRELLISKKLKEMAAKRGLTPEQLIFRFALDAGMTPLTGTTNADHMREDLAAAAAAPLTNAEARTIASIK